MPSRKLRTIGTALALAVPLAALAQAPAEDAGPPAPDGPPASSLTQNSSSSSSSSPPPSSDDRLRIYDRVEIRERGDDLLGVAGAASEGTTGAADLAARPVLRAGELIETVPGLVATQHSGGGKANQYFVRGFNLDHGTDFSVTVAGVPVNLPSHGHGQGYADLNFLIPELIDRVRYRKGTYAAEKGDFSAAGAVDVDLVRSLPEPLLLLGGGGFAYGRLLVADSWEVAGGDLLAGFEASTFDGPWERGDDFDRAAGVVRYTRGDALAGGSLTAMGYDASWRATDQIPQRAVDSGRIDRFDLLDPGPGGSSRRIALSGELHRGGERALSSLAAYAVDYDLELFSNFTYFLDQPELGDQFRQLDDRRIFGVEASHRRLTEWAGRPVETAAGVQVRFDAIDNGLARTANRVPFAVVRADAIDQWGAGAWGEASVRWSDTVRTTFGLRLDGFEAEVDSDLAANSGRADDRLVSPKLGLALGPWRSTEVYLNAGRGFHSNDARGATIRVDPVSGEAVDRVDPLVPARGAELGVRTSALPGLVSTVALFGLELDSELLFVGDGGTTEASRPSRRLGVEWTNHYRLREGVWLDLDVALSRARFTDQDPAGDRIPGALERVVSAGILAVERGPWSFGARLRYFSGYPLIEDDSVRAGATALLAARVAYRFASGMEIGLEGFNLLDREDADIAYFYASRLPGEEDDGVEDVHFHPVEKPSARLTLRWRR